MTVIERSDVDCLKGREIGCQTYCCCLLVRLEPTERIEREDGSLPSSFVDKAEDGYCIHFNRASKLCSVWHNRPKVCREFSCNSDELLQVALRAPFTSLVDLVKKAQQMFIPKETHIRIPCCGDSHSDES